MRIGVIDLLTKGSTHSLWGRVMNANFASIMPQVTAAWCEQEGHDVYYLCFTGFEDLSKEIPDDLDLVFISCFTQCAQLSYALSNLLRSRGTITALGGPHARAYPQDAVQYFDYVFGFTDRALIRDVLQDCTQHRPAGIHVSAKQQPADLPGVRERWRFIDETIQKAPFLKAVMMIGSLGCPYTCSFCMDSVVPYQQLSFEVMKEDLRFLLRKFKRPRVGWLDPNFGVRFDEYLDAIEEAVPPDSIDFFAESSLALLGEARLKRLQRSGFKVMMPGIESWFDLGNKSKTGKRDGMEKVRKVSEHINMIMSYIPYLQANFVVGLDVDHGPEPFELTKEFVDLSPGAYPAYSLLSAFGEAAPLNLEYQKAGRLLPFPFHFLNTQAAMNVRPKDYEWPEFFELLIDLTKYTFSKRAIFNRYRAIKPPVWRWLNVLRGLTAQGIGRVNYYSEIVRLLRTDRSFRAYFEQETTELPQFFVEQVRQDLGPFWEWLPEGALHHDPYAYLKSQQETSHMASWSKPVTIQSEEAASN
ncbi:radical SAM protein [candidate division KSB1 bacterium]|nr:radical SAM protein [candidate division KSB1 bacterium]NIR71726.1 radical SAM protein [candidate division KSB1 bacterium]NIS26407.1 radical SAM protein [candidate division KSB1 bacterium]NIT73166.1 radical SAM protein [candidate division KSB1 bacterium]NIU27093.1 radical SAM protein [candidate division KSB1 bacterium]